MAHRRLPYLMVLINATRLMIFLALPSRVRENLLQAKSLLL